ncbi:hypothetical protein CN918_30890 [Priestia megaterium]|nr:hypothetical protein CN918_30890 [Priestia megaterium]
MTLITKEDKEKAKELLDIIEEASARLGMYLEKNPKTGAIDIVNSEFVKVDEDVHFDGEKQMIVSKNTLEDLGVTE